MKIRISFLLLFLFFFSDVNKVNNINTFLKFDEMEYLCKYFPKKGYSRAKNEYLLSKSNNDNFGLSQSLYFLGLSSGNLGNHAESLKFLNTALENILVSEDKNNEILKAYIDFEIARQLGKLQFHSKAIKLFDDLVLKVNKFKDSEKKFFLLADLFSHKGFYIRTVKPDFSYQEIIKYHFYAKNLINNCKTKKHNYAYSNIGITYQSFGDFKNAFNYFILGIKEAKKFKINNIGIVYHNIGRLLLENARYKEALVYLDSSQQYAGKFSHIKKENYIVSANCFVKLNDKKNATINFRKASIINEILIKNQNKVIVESTNFLLQDSDSKNYNFKKQYVFFIILFSFTIIILVLMIKSYKTKYLDKIRKSNIEKSEFNNEIVILKQKVKGSYDEVLELAKSNDPLFFPLFKELYDDFYNNLILKHPNLTLTEQKVCFYLKLKFTTKEIASYSFVSIKAIQNRKNRLRNKLGLHKSEDLYNWIENF